MTEIFDAIQNYAAAYKRLEQIQRARPLDIPRGDQKTGVIAEFYARVYARMKFPGAKFEFGSPSEHAWDLKVLLEQRPAIKIQVKAVSAHSETGRVSPIHPGWHQLWLMRLDDNLYPEALWILDDSSSPWAEGLLKNRTMPAPGKANSGSAELRGGINETSALLEALATASPAFQRTARKRASAEP